MKRWGWLVAVGIVALVAFWMVGQYNGLVGLEQNVRAQWGQVENVYQRRADLIPNLVETVKGAANFEKETFTQVAEARSRVSQVTAVGADKLINDPDALKKFQEAQQGLGAALGRLIAVSERYPDLKATAGFRDLQAQLEGTENRIAVERMRFNEVARDFNARRQSFPTVFIAGLFGSRFSEKAYFQAQAGADQAPKVKF